MMDDEIIFDFNKLRGKIKEVYGTQASFASAMETNEATLSNKLNNNVEFTQKEILKACRLLGVDNAKIAEYFFTLKVQVIEPV